MITQTLGRSGRALDNISRAGMIAQKMEKPQAVGVAIMGLRKKPMRAPGCKQSGR